MRGQEYTLFNYLVWMVFAGAFLLAAIGVYRAVIRHGTDVTQHQVIEILRDAGKMDIGCVHSEKPIFLPSGFTLTADFVKEQMGLDSSASVCFAVGQGVELKDNKKTVEVKNDIRAYFSVCKNDTIVRVCINRPEACLSAGPITCP